MNKKSGFPTYPPDFKVRYRFLSPDEGGRRSIPAQGYKPNWLYDGDEFKNILFDIFPEFEDASGEPLPRGAQALAQGNAGMYILNNELKPSHRQRIRVGTKGWICEGPRKVAEAEVISIIGLNQER